MKPIDLPTQRCGCREGAAVKRTGRGAPVERGIRLCLKPVCNPLRSMPPIGLLAEDLRHQGGELGAERDPATTNGHGISPLRDSSNRDEHVS